MATETPSAAAEAEFTTLYLTGKRQGATVALGSFGRYRFKNGMIKIPSKDVGTIKMLKKFYACTTTKPEPAKEAEAAAKSAPAK